MNTNDWAKQSFEISESFVYANIKEGDDLPEDYLTKAQEIAERQIVLGGTRLANLLMSLKLDSHFSAVETAFL